MSQTEQISSNTLKVYIDHELTSTEMALYERQEGNCYICSDTIELEVHDIIKTPCDHIYHYDCLYYTICENSINPRKKRNLRQIRECPYCRTHIEYYLPIFKTDSYPLVKHVNYTNILLCRAILKSGKRKGEYCDCHVIDNSIFCGRHKNCKQYDTSMKGCFISQ